MDNRFMLGLATLVGTIIGAGIFGLPYVVAKAGVIPSLFYFLALGGVVLLLHLMFGEIVLRSPRKHRLIGYAGMYLGPWAKRAATFSTLVGATGALLAYIILAGDFLQILFSSVFDVQTTWYSFLFWGVLSLLVIRGIQAIATAELVMNIALFAVAGTIFFFAAPHVEPANFHALDIRFAFLPYGVVFFAFVGLSAIPEIAELFRNKKEKRGLDNLIVWASVLTGLLYAAFSFFVVGVSGEGTTQNSLSGLGSLLGEGVVVLGALFGLVAIAASFLVLGNYLKNSLRHDYKVPYALAFSLTLGAPLALFVLGLREFIAVIGVIGAAMAVIDGGLVVLIHRKAAARRERVPEYALRLPRFVPWLIILFLLAGAAAEFLVR